MLDMPTCIVPQNQLNLDILPAESLPPLSAKTSASTVFAYHLYEIRHLKV